MTRDEILALEAGREADATLKWTRQPDGSYASEAGIITKDDAVWRFRSNWYTNWDCYLSRLKAGVAEQYGQHLLKSIPLTIPNILQCAVSGMEKRAIRHASLNGNGDPWEMVLLGAIRQCAEMKVRTPELEQALRRWWESLGRVVA